jgi:hypothetical protein
MADYRQRIDPPAQYKNMFGDRSKKPMSVQMAEIGVEFTPAGTIFGLNDIKEELQKENPDYYKVGMMAGVEAIGLIPGLGDAAVESIKAGARKAGLDKVADQTDVLLGGPKVNPELEIFGGARAQYPPNMTGYGSIDTTFNAEADSKTLEDLGIDFENDPSGSMVRMVDEIERNPNKYPATLKEVVAGKWFRGRDDLMRFEIDDSQSEILGSGVGDIVQMDEDDMDAYLSGFSFGVDSKFPDNSIQGMPGEKAFTTLEDILKHDKLYSQYPQLRDAPVIEDTAYFKRNPNVLGYFDDSSGTIAINTNKIKTNEELRDTLLHEVQHLVQHLEDFESGTNVRNADVLEIKKAIEGSPEYQKAFVDYNIKVSEYLKNRDSAIETLYDKNKEVALKVLDIVLDDFSKKTQVPVEEVYARLAKGETFKSVAESAPIEVRIENYVYTPEFEEILHIAEGNVGGMAPTSGIGLNRSLDDVSPRESAAPYFEMVSGRDKTDLIADNNRWQQHRIASTVRSLIKDNPELAKDFENSLGFSVQDFLGASSSQDKVGELYGIPNIAPPAKPRIVRNYIIYSTKRGEVEARNVSARKDMTASERTPENVFDTEDTSPTRQWGEPEVQKARSGQNPLTGFENGPSASQNFTPKDYGYTESNPGGEWVENKQRRAEEMAALSSPENAGGKMLSGPITAALGGDFKNSSLFLDTKFLSKLRGANDENRRAGDVRYDRLKKQIQERGFDPEQKSPDLEEAFPDSPGNAIVIGVNHKGEAFILEGNTRVAIANEMDVPSVRAEVKYFNGAEEVDSPFSPQNILQYAEQPRQFAKGGAVNNMSMKQQMSLFEYGGIADDGMTKDPVSGNEVPPGSLAKEVRDDIPAMLSEGEYVVPADVLRFYGVNFFENLRNQAKSGLQNMEQNGRIGGTPMDQQDVARNMQQVPPPPQPMAPPAVQAAQGGMMQSPMRIQQQPAPQAMGNAAPQQQPMMANQGMMVQGYQGNDGSMVSRWSPARARYSSPMFQGTSSQQANIAAAQQQADTQAAEEITQFRKHYNAAGESVQVKYVGTGPDNMRIAEGQDDTVSQYPLTEQEFAAYKKEMSRGSGDDGGTTPEPTSQGSDTSWMEGIDYTDSASVQKWANDTLKQDPIMSKLGKMGGVIPGGISALDRINKVSQVRGMAQLQREAGNTELADALDKQADAVVEAGGIGMAAFEKLGFMTGNSYADQLRETLGTTVQMQKVLGQPGTASSSSAGLSGDTEESRRQIALEEELMSQPVGKDSGSSKATMEYHKKLREEAIAAGKAREVKTDSGGTTTVYEQGASPLEQQIAAEASGPKDLSWMNQNKGGLMTKGKKKKK